MADVGDISKMSEYAIEILKDSSKLSLFKQQAKLRSHEFALDKILPIYENLYKKVNPQ
jgi:hypothetical protein